MTSIALVKLIIDGLLLLSLAVVALRLLGRQQPSTIANLTKLKELEASLKDIVRDADDAGRSLSQELLGRKRDLEKLLSEVEGVESRFNKSKNAGEDLVSAAAAAQIKLEQLVNRQLELQRVQEQQITASLNQREISRPTAYDNSEIRREYSQQASQQKAEPISFDYRDMLEPPSFSKQLKRPATLREQIEVQYSQQAATALNQNLTLRSNEPAEFIVSEPATKPVKQSQQMRADPRLGVLAATNRDSNLF